MLEVFILPSPYLKKKKVDQLVSSALTVSSHQEVSGFSASDLSMVLEGRRASAGGNALLYNSSKVRLLSRLPSGSVSMTFT